MTSNNQSKDQHQHFSSILNPIKIKELAFKRNIPQSSLNIEKITIPNEFDSDTCDGVTKPLMTMKHQPSLVSSRRGTWHPERGLLTTQDQ